MEIVTRRFYPRQSRKRLECFRLEFIYDLFSDRPPQTLYQSTQGDHTFELRIIRFLGRLAQME